MFSLLMVSRYTTSLRVVVYTSDNHPSKPDRSLYLNNERLPQQTDGGIRFLDAIILFRPTLTASLSSGTIGTLVVFKSCDIPYASLLAKVLTPHGVQQFTCRHH